MFSMLNLAEVEEKVERPNLCRYRNGGKHYNVASTYIEIRPLM